MLMMFLFAMFVRPNYKNKRKKCFIQPGNITQRNQLKGNPRHIIVLSPNRKPPQKWKNVPDSFVIVLLNKGLWQM